MIYPIRAYGDPVLRIKCKEINDFGADFQKLVVDMYETMDASDGVGLAAPQIGKPLRLFMIDSTLFDKEKKEGVRTAFINPTIVDETGEEFSFEEGCLSIPGVREDVVRKAQLTLKYQSITGENFEKSFDGMTARVIQHEYDHIEGVLFTDHISPFKRQLLKSKLAKISSGKVNVHYRMKFPKRK
ncbi:MAG: peptide deformylase [Bacteroidia bacterium]|jgi:peptide deformylase|nr:peptide deformylase [Bacteroidia bacterium]